jgi:hypothetical protein
MVVENKNQKRMGAKWIISFLHPNQLFFIGFEAKGLLYECVCICRWFRVLELVRIWSAIGSETYLGSVWQSFTP